MHSFSRMEQRLLRKIFGEARWHQHPADDLNAFKFLENWLQEHPPAMSFHARTQAEFATWKDQARPKLRELLGHPFPDADLAPQVIKETTVRNITIQKIRFHTQPHMTVVAFLAYPAGSSGGLKRPVMVCLPGHGAGKVGSLALGWTPNHETYGIDLAAKGFVSLTLEQFGFGERAPRAKEWLLDPEGVYMRVPQLFGLSPIGIRAWDVIRSLDFLETLPFVDPNNIGCVGNSGGGMVTAFSAAVDVRIKAAIISGYFCSYWYSIISLSHCPCNYVPHLMQYFDAPDLVAMRAPQPTFIVSGEADWIFPQEGVQKAYTIAQQAYGLAGAPQNLGIHVMPKTGHRFSGKLAYPWLKKQLKGT